MAASDKLTFDQEVILFFFEMGRALTKWAEVEYSLAHLVAKCVEPKERYMMLLGFHSIENFRARIRFATSVLGEKFRTHPRLKDWDGVSDRLEQCAAKRNRLAHRRTWHYDQNKEGRRIALIPAPKFDKHGKDLLPSTGKPPVGALCLRDISASRGDFVAAWVCLENFDARLHNRRELFPESDEQPQAPIPTRRLYAQIQTTLGLREKPSQKKS